MSRDWRTRKRGTGNQPGSHFLSTTVTGDLKRDVIKERYLRKLMQESKTHDVSATKEKILGEGKALATDLRNLRNNMQKDRQNEAEVIAKLDIIKNTLEALDSLAKHGMTRIGDSELKHIIRSIVREKGFDPERFLLNL